MMVISKINYNLYKRFAYLGYFISLLLMLAVLIPGIGVSVKGATRWLGVGILKFQPSEIMKIMLVIAVSSFITINFKKIKNWMGYIPAILMLLGVCIAMFFQNHLSGTIIMIAGALSVIFASGIKLNFKVIMAIVLIAGLAGGIFIFSEDFRMQRITAFLNPEQDLKGDNWQAAQSLYAIGTGGVFGLRITVKVDKSFYGFLKLKTISYFQYWVKS